MTAGVFFQNGWGQKNTLEFHLENLGVKNHCSSELETTVVSSQPSKFADWGCF